MGRVPGRDRRRGTGARGMTTAAPPCALVTVVTKATTAGGPAYPMCVHWSWRGGRRPPSEPPVSRAAAVATDGRGRRPRTPARMRSRLSGAPLWSPPASRGRARPPSASRQAHRLPDALEPGHEVVSGLGERWLDACVGSEDHAAAGDIAGRLLHPPRRRVRSLPAGITRAAGAGWERPRTRQKGRQKPPVSGPSIPRMEGGRSQPHSPPKSGDSGSRGCE